MVDDKRYVGIDVAKARLDVALGLNGERFAVANDERGIRALLKRLKPNDLVIIEATGGLEVPVASTLATAGIAVTVVNPRQVRDFARATGQLAKITADLWVILMREVLGYKQFAAEGGDWGALVAEQL